MSLVRNGRARLALALPRHRDHLRRTKNRELDNLFEAYALAATALEALYREVPQREELIVEYQRRCLDIHPMW
ncbi:hypothetical protein CO661_02005 [Sinorhizobium fredii]|uniref:Uncharacterized protein n=1 Tax=Rhizobium fredii TaxID=380 RepID=A0A2A6M7K5_RHIFR|nr:hypothetical protein CO661_02005 [Sinorhizobium fredii]